MAVKKWATTNGTVWSYNGTIVTSLVDSENPQGIPPSTIRLKFSDPNYNPTTQSFDSNLVWTQVSASPNVWDAWYGPTSPSYQTSWAAFFYNKFNDHTNTVEVVGANFSGIFNVSQLFARCSSLLSVGNIDFGDAIVAQGMFDYCSNLRTVGDIVILGSPIYDQGGHATFQVNIYQMFEYCDKLTTVGNIRIDHASSLEAMFYRCYSLRTIGTVYAPEVIKLESMFYGCNSLEVIPSMTLSDSAYNFSRSFYNCSSLTSCPIVSSMDNAIYCDSTFYNCRAMTSLPAFSGRQITDISNMFSQCVSLTGTIPAYDFRNVDKCSNAFKDCRSLSGGALATYNRFMSYEIQPTEYNNCFTNCGIDTQTGSAELAQIPTSWGGTMA